MFNFFKKKNKGMEVDAVVDGNIMPITDVKDDVFSTKMLGDGYAIKPSDKNIYAPVSGTISTLFPTKHAIGIKTDKGLEILIHLGLDTVELKGAPFTVAVSQGDKVEKGQPLGTMDFQMITDKGYDDSCIVVYTNMDLVKSVTPIEKGTVQHSQKVQTVEFN
ncbi:PTS glucose transporter subunit IIA [Lactobacillus kefiranofaciens]|uniref:PTS sugar transporter subunit IIA n=1 Tax=Lactobacillus kefiranofaciens TaxID=267818 RepID=UPI0023EAF01F|nr:PTS glucose transporter subunit IIA [Lactobacillus kefiranofaciens]MDF4142456.1 PTS glucose transporter subunit IIA [Lactobacillus kefiranofaciens]MDH5099872.1 PTS glucose transporter subunit IIA [Lactobacillus kefiranofaciens]